MNLTSCLNPARKGNSRKDFQPSFEPVKADQGLKNQAKIVEQIFQPFLVIPPGMLNKLPMCKRTAVVEGICKQADHPKSTHNHFPPFLYLFIVGDAKISPANASLACLRPYSIQVLNP